MKVKLATAFAAGVLVAGIVGFFRPAPASPCRTGDLGTGIDAETAKELEGLGAWVHHARECHVGDYLVAAPDRLGSPDMIVLRTGKPLLLLSGNTRMLLDADGRRVLYHSYQWESGKSISYAGYDAARHAWIDNIDFGADGDIDFRTTEISGRQVKQEAKIGDRWLEVLNRDGTTGVVIDGTFMSVDDARKKAAAREGSVQ